MELVVWLVGGVLLESVRPQGAARRPGGLGRVDPLAGDPHPELHRARHDAGDVQALHRLGGGDVQPGGEWEDRRGALHGAGPVSERDGEAARRRGVKALVTILASSFAIAYAWTWLPLPPTLLVPPTIPALTLTDRHGAVLRTTRAEDGSRARWLRLEEIDPDLLAAFVAAEDRRFYDHHGVDWLAALRALRDDITSLHVVSGASTITMQLARMLTGSSRSPVGKFSQSLWALRLEHHLTKQQILEQYLDRVPLGQATLGVESAAQLYFARSAS